MKNFIEVTVDDSGMWVKFLININAIQSISGSVRGTKIWLVGDPKDYHISESYIKVKEFIEEAQK